MYVFVSTVMYECMYECICETLETVMYECMHVCIYKYRGIRRFRENDSSQSS